MKKPFGSSAPSKPWWKTTASTGHVPANRIATCAQWTTASWLMGAGRVIVVDHLEYRLEKARSFA
ncbi:hypothetical protein J2X98_003211 [Pseudarthrobacter enclensis]|uniref:Uncharacterized protein n=1 Tax=Pseudarthrobacter enclensis TaxID=993070 RepID=A0ABT9RXW8_9MICC|nr:hypothetical protein [Pseudarthrobacter enclensis]